MKDAETQYQENLPVQSASAGEGEAAAGGKTVRGPSPAGLSLAALGVVFGDIGTSPLYAVRESFHGDYRMVATPANVLGVLSLIFWALISIVTVKYLIFILRADNHGEGGVLALTALLRRAAVKKGNHGRVLVTIGLFAAALLYGDGMITPAISVLSAVEGLRVIAPAFAPYVLPVTVAILAGLFLIQQHGTARVGGLFGPVILLWFAVIAVLGLNAIARQPGILAALSPWHAVVFLGQNGLSGFVVLGAVFLVVTGAEALYADLGHFGRRPIRMTWALLVLPALVLNYFGQGAVLLSSPGAAGHPFYALVPSWAVVPMVVLATMATIIASQAVITGAFSLTRQAVQLGYLPRLKIMHTSARHMGQIYVAPVNWLLMTATIGLVMGFHSSSQLAAAYGVAVTSTMLISTILFYAVARETWGWSRPAAAIPAGFFMLVDLAFFGANMTKLLHGAWFPLVIGGAVFALMTIWKRERGHLAEHLKTATMTFEHFKKSILDDAPQRVNGQAVFLTGNPDAVPAALLHNLTHNKVLHAEVVILHIATEEIPRVPNDRKIELEKLGNGFFKVVAHYGFMENPNMANILSLVREKGLDLKPETISFFLGRLRLLVGPGTGPRRWPKRIFAFLARNAAEAAAYYGVPTEQVMEVGLQFRL
jgi:KUP system potassium uptake protein